MQQRASIWFVFTVVLIDMIGFGLVMPVLPGLIMHLGKMPVDTAAIWAGWLGAGYAAMQFVFAPIIGNLSDRFGRRPVLLACLFAFGCDYLLQGLAPSLWWLVVGRVIAGITGASFAAAYAYIADVTEPADRAAAFGTMGMAFGFGFIIGPALGGFLGEFGPRVPFLAAAGLAFANVLFGFFFLRESLSPERRRPFSLARANAFAALKVLSRQDRTVLWLVAALGVWALAHTVYPSIWAYFAIEAYGWSPGQIGLSLTMVGVGSALVQGLLMRWLIPRVGEVRAVVIGVIALVAVTMVFAFVRYHPVIYVALVVNGLQGLVQPSINSLNSRAVDAESQGELQGASQAIGSLAMIAGPLLYTGIFAKFAGPQAVFDFPAMPLVVASAIAVGAMILVVIGTRRVRDHCTGDVA
ncbi:Tetracycline resistance protein, class C [Tsuneonella dongtanensis]|uniref:Tetracycline resistance protein, class C n=1 Tax=Tsuneonella dongtanensis TaxID=692370 RepID=A0A1B2AB24_9SPHN|nr:TCR/Tet family MFS transporter [Tsuneonella dongtanensis]ANY19245.1 Tetracycline resistance protein, class C [Tsuneonella dongtanensis]